MIFRAPSTLARLPLRSTLGKQELSPVLRRGPLGLAIQVQIIRHQRRGGSELGVAETQVRFVRCGRVERLALGLAVRRRGADELRRGAQAYPPMFGLNRS